MEYRLDYILRESNLGVSYLSALTSHTAYWTNYDVAYFVLTQIFPEFENNDSNFYSEKSYSNYPQNCQQDSQYNYENQSYNQYNDPNFRGNERGNFSNQSQVDGRMQGVSHAAQGPHFNQPPPPRFPPHNYQNMPDYSHQYPPNAGPQNYSESDQQNYLVQHPPGHPQQYSQPPYETQPVVQRPQNYQQPPNYLPSQQNQRHPTPPPSQSCQQPVQYHQPPQNYSQQQNYSQDQASFQNYPVQPQLSQHQNPQTSHQAAGPPKSVQTKTGFFDKITDDKKIQGAASPTKSTKSFFPSFNLSSLTSPVKNLSNSLSNISNQMTNIGNSAKDNVGSSNVNPPGRLQTNFLGNTGQNKAMSSNSAQPTRTQSPQVQYNQGQFGQYQSVSSGPNQLYNQNSPQSIRSTSPYEVHSMGVRSGSPVSLQNRCSPMQYGPIETPVGAIKPKTIRLQPKVPVYEQKGILSHDSTNVSNKTRCVSPLGQSRVVCSGSRSALPTSYGGLPLGGRSLSSGNLRNSTLVCGTYPGSRSNYNYLGQSGYLSHSGLDRRTMSRPNLSSTGSTCLGSGLGMSSLVYNSPYTGSRNFLSREYSGSSSR